MASSLEKADPGVLGLEAVAPLKNYPALPKKTAAHDPKEDVEAFEKDPVGYMDKNRRKMSDKYAFARVLAPKLARAFILALVLQRLARGSRMGKFISMGVLGGSLAMGLHQIGANRPELPNAPGSPTWIPWLGTLLTGVRWKDNVHGMMKKVLKENNFGSFEMNMPGGNNMVVIRDARDNEYILRRNFRNYPNNVPGKTLSNLEVLGAELAGRGIFMTDGPEWSYHRKRASHMFSANELQHKMERVFQEHSEKFAIALRRIADEHRVVNIQDLIASVVFDTFCDISFSVQTEQFDEMLRTGNKPKFLDAFDKLQNVTAERFPLPPVVWHAMRLFGLGTEGEVAKSLKIVNDYIYPIVEERLKRKNDPDSPRDLLSLYLSEGEEMDAASLRDIIMNFMIAGRDTTSSTLTSSVCLLSESPQVEAKLSRHLDIGRNISWEDAKQFAYPNAVFNEVIRMNPPVPSFLRCCQEDDVLPSGQPVKKGTHVLIPMQVLGRRPELWNNPDDFNPERWMVHGDDKTVKRPDEFVFPVFWGGYRLCLGKDMARSEALTFLKTILVDHKLKIRIEPGQDLETIANGPVHFVKAGVMARVMCE